ncbi:MAG: NAD(P)-binding domain-containing protein [Rhizobiales bacterium]|nr:NAD(P)-binding domain-containing protein [Hyphomicrobiales bacterium]
MKVGIAGAGSVAFGCAALLEQAGHRPILWSPSGERTKALAAGEPLVAEGAFLGKFRPAIATGAEELAAEADIIVIALPAYGHKAVFDALAPHVRDDQTVLISSHASFGALYLSKLLAARGLTVPIVAWGTTALTGRQRDMTRVLVTTVRSKIDLATVPDSESRKGLAMSRRLFGERFVQRDGLLAIALSNLNPQNHMGIALGNMTRMERGEVWSQGENVTPNVGRLLEALDRERLAIAESLGLSVRTIFEHFHLSFHVPIASISDMNQEMHREGRGGTGPATADSRYVSEDVPFGLLPTVVLGEMTGQTARLHRAGVDIFSAMYGVDFSAANDLLPALDLAAMPLAQLRMLAREGFPLDQN